MRDNCSGSRQKTILFACFQRILNIENQSIIKDKSFLELLRTLKADDGLIANRLHWTLHSL